jgi:hypothetical protein
VSRRDDTTAVWSLWEPAACDLCGDDLEVYTAAPEGYVYDADPIRCGEGHTGRIHADESGAWAVMRDEGEE